MLVGPSAHGHSASMTCFWCSRSVGAVQALGPQEKKKKTQYAEDGRAHPNRYCIRIICTRITYTAHRESTTPLADRTRSAGVDSDRSPKSARYPENATRVSRAFCGLKGALEAGSKSWTAESGARSMLSTQSSLAGGTSATTSPGCKGAGRSMSELRDDRPNTERRRARGVPAAAAPRPCQRIWMVSGAPGSWQSGPASADRATKRRFALGCRSRRDPADAGRGVPEERYSVYRPGLRVQPWNEARGHTSTNLEGMDVGW